MCDVRFSLVCSVAINGHTQEWFRSLHSLRRHSISLKNITITWFSLSWSHNPLWRLWRLIMVAFMGKERQLLYVHYIISYFLPLFEKWKVVSGKLKQFQSMFSLLDSYWRTRPSYTCFEREDQVTLKHWHSNKLSVLVTININRYITDIRWRNTIIVYY